MNKFHRWLLNEMELWQADGIINSAQAKQITKRYQNTGAASWGKIIFSAIGAIIFGLGIVLLFAYNWDVMHRFTKLGLIFLAIMLVHGFAYKLNAPQFSHQKLGESLFLLGTMLFGAGIWLVAQIYHIDEHYPNGILVWAFGALALAWVIPSLAQAMLAMALLTLWHWTEALDFDRVNHWGSWLIALGIIPLAWMQHSRSLLFFSIAIFLSSYAITVAQLDLRSGIVITTLFALACSYIIISRIASSTQFPQSQGVFRFVGLSVYAVLLYIMSLGDFHRHVYKYPPDLLGAQEWFYWLFPMGLAMASVLVLFIRYPDIIAETIDRIETGIVLVALIVVLLLSFQVLPAYKASWIALSILFLAHSLLLIWRGTQTLRWQSAALGSAMLSAFVFARFLDLFQSLLMRSLAFLLLGAALFAIGIYYSRQKQRQGEQHHA